MNKIATLIAVAIGMAVVFTIAAANPYLTDALYTTSELSSKTPAQGQIVVDTTKSILVVGNGSTVGGIALARQDLSTSILTANRAIETSAGGVLEASAITDTELSYLDDASSNIQTQLNAKQAAATAATFTSAAHTADTGVVTDGYIVIKLGEQSYKVMTTP